MKELSVGAKLFLAKEGCSSIEQWLKKEHAKDAAKTKAAYGKRGYLVKDADKRTLQGDAEGGKH